MTQTVEQVEQLLTGLQTTLHQLVRLQADKQTALSALDSAALERLAEQEGELVAQLTEASQRRRQILAQNASEFHPAGSLRELVKLFPKDQRYRLLERLDRVRGAAQGVKLRAGANWLVAYRANQHVRRLLEIIAHAGRPGVGEGLPASGLLLDRTA